MVQVLPGLGLKSAAANARDTAPPVALSAAARIASGLSSSSASSTRVPDFGGADRAKAMSSMGEGSVIQANGGFTPERRQL
jgi:hypothetical protein